MNSRLRLATYLSMSIPALATWVAGLSPLFTQNKDLLNTVGMLGVVAFAIPLLIFRSRWFYLAIRETATSPGVSMSLHRAILGLLVASTAVAVVIALSGLVGIGSWKNVVLALVGIFFFNTAGWLLKPPRFLMQ